MQFLVSSLNLSCGATIRAAHWKLETGKLKTYLLYNSTINCSFTGS